MRFVVGVLACVGVGVGGMSVALADPPTSPPAASPTTAAASARAAAPAPAVAPAAAAKPADSADEQEEKRLLSEGYRKEMRHGSVYFCRRQEVLGSRLGGELVCGTPQALRAAEAQAREMVERAQRQQTNPTVH